MRYRYHWLGLAFLALAIVRLILYVRHGKHFVWLLPLLLAGSVSAHTFSLVNLTGMNTNFAYGIVVPPGVTKVEESSNFVNYWNTVSIFSIYADQNYQFVIDVTGAADFGVVQMDDVESTTNYGPAVAAGMGAGFLWFGFGWVLRLGKKIPDC